MRGCPEWVCSAPEGRWFRARDGNPRTAGAGTTPPLPSPAGATEPPRIPGLDGYAEVVGYHRPGSRGAIPGLSGPDSSAPLAVLRKMSIGLSGRSTRPSVGLREGRDGAPSSDRHGE